MSKTTAAGAPLDLDKLEALARDLVDRLEMHNDERMYKEADVLMAEAANIISSMLVTLVHQVAPSRPGNTPRVDALMAKWDDDGATRGAAFVELRDLARELEALARCAAPSPQSASVDAIGQDERALFEAWATRSGAHVTLSHVFSFTPHPNRNRYLEGTTELCWRVWQARAALTHPSVQERQTQSPAPAIDVKHEFEMWASNRGESAVYIGDGLYQSSSITDQAEAFAAGVELARAAASQAAPATCQPSGAIGQGTTAVPSDIRGPLTDEQRQECRYLYNNLKHLEAGGWNTADDVIRKAAVYGYMNGRHDFATPAEPSRAADEPPTAKPFAGPGAWFSIDILGNPMREYTPGKWEVAEWPSVRAAIGPTTEQHDDCVWCGGEGLVRPDPEDAASEDDCAHCKGTGRAAIDPEARDE